jgi:molybdopterin biosynthesis enzyme MoaB
MMKPAALVSRSVAGVMGKTLVYSLPGSLKGVNEYCLEILPTIIHSIKMILGLDDHHC